MLVLSSDSLQNVTNLRYWSEVGGKQEDAEANSSELLGLSLVLVLSSDSLQNVTNLRYWSEVGGKQEDAEANSSELLGLSLVLVLSSNFQWKARCNLKMLLLHI